jgi:Expansin C-terminal domain
MVTVLHRQKAVIAAACNVVILLNLIWFYLQETGGRGAVQVIQIRGSDSGSDNWEAMQNVWGAEWASVSHQMQSDTCW